MNKRKNWTKGNLRNNKHTKELFPPKKSYSEGNNGLKFKRMFLMRDLNIKRLL